MHGIGPKMAIFPTFYFRQYKRKCLLRYSRAKKRLFKVRKQKFEKVEKLTFFQKRLAHGFGPKMAFFQVFFLGNIGQENVFYHILEQKTVFVFYKNNKFQKSKIDIFQKGLTHGFCPKMVIFPKGLTRCFDQKMHIFPTFFSGDIGLENVFCDILERKKRLSRL